MDIGQPFIRLPYAFDDRRLAAEAASLPAAAWMAHPSGMQGNTAVALVSRDGADNDDFEGAMRPTPHLRSCPYVLQAMASFGEVLGRSRLMKLAPGCEVATHVDFNYHWYTRVRIHIPVVTEPDVAFFCADERVHMRAGECWIFNSWRRHRVVNGGQHDRIHLVIDTAGSSRFWRMVRDAAADGPRAAGKTRFIACDASPGPELRTEQFNTAPVMAPGEIDAMIREVIADFSANPQNDPQLATRYRHLLSDFAADWRETWLQHGYQPAGWSRYRELVDRLRSGLHPNPRALVTSSNEIGVNPIIVQRILRPALATEHLDQFVDGLSSKQ